MKKLLAILLVCCLCVSLTACSKMDKYKDNLEDDYEIDRLSDDDLELYAKLLKLDIDDYEVESAIEATHEKKGIGVVIIECGSAKLAAELADDADEIVDLLEATYSDKYSFDIVQKGRCVLFGEEDAIEDALGE